MEDVDRPTGRARKPVTWDVGPFLATAETGRAVRIALDGVSVYAWQSRLREAARRAGLRAYIRQHGPDAIIAWCEQQRPPYARIS
jgi:hypothetical protein